MKYEGARCLLPQFMGSQTNGADLWMRASRNLGLIGLYLVSQFEASFGSWLGTPCFGVQHQFFYLSFFFLRWSKIPSTWAWPDAPISRADLDVDVKRFNEKALESYHLVIGNMLLMSAFVTCRGLQKLSGESIIFLFSQVDGGDEGHKWVY